VHVTAIPDSDLKARHRKMWASGDYPSMVETFLLPLGPRLVEACGIEPGMRVLDVGCGAGDVSFLAAALVGPDGTVIGVDKATAALDLARQRAQAAGLANVHFVEGDAATLRLDAPVDAVIGRLVLMYFPDPAAVLGHLLGLLTPGGVVAFHEFDLEAAKSEPRCEIVETAVARVKQTFARVGVDGRTGLKLRSIFRRAGLPAPHMIQGARVEGGPDAHVYGEIAHVTRTLLPVMVQTGVATAAEVDIDSLAARLRDEVVANDAVLVSPAFIGAWARHGLT
jgi:SAM-dependent methyltransferase